MNQDKAFLKGVHKPEIAKAVEKKHRQMTKAIEVVWEAQYCFCVHESSYETLSIHRTERGARKAMLQHKLKERKDYQEHIKWLKKEGHYRDYDFGKHEGWGIAKIKIED